MYPEAVTALELDAYLDGELDESRCLAVEDYLSRNPEAAARMMADFSRRTALRLGQPHLPERIDLAAAAAQLDHGMRAPARPIAHFLARRKWMSGLAAAAAVAALVLVPNAPIAQAGPPTYVGDAIQAYHTSLIRADMPSQLETTRFDARDVQRFTRIRIPVLPAGWRITDVQLFPSEEGPALQLMVRIADGQTVSLFAVRSRTDAPAQPATVQKGRTTVAYWRNGDMAYALTGVDAPAALDLAAKDLADNGLG
ncbi:anti-sigma factor family protein [Sphingomonas sp. ASY06-1R]|uniref:anti-sigma factor family protein n=1 Tax=Sphingomonas sp. ASY06-1R TaxID=3445771 RepID=UPI003FA20D88